MKKNFAILMIFISTAFVFQSCKKDSDVADLTETKVEFTFNTTGLKSSMNENLTHVVITVEDEKGNVVKDNEKIEIYNMNGNYISKPISLLTGNYKLTGFFVLNSANNVMYAAPIEGSDKAYLVNEPLPIEFTTVKDVVTKVNPEVLSTSESHPQDFGYASFGFNIAETFDFLVGAFVYNETSANFELTTAQIQVYSDETLIYSGDLQANTDITPDNYDPLGITNKITLPETYNSFTVKVSKSGYISYNATFTKDELKLYYRNEDNGPLIVILDSITGLLAYYPFDGNYYDISGNDYHGSNYGSMFDIDRLGATNSSVKFDGIDDYILLPTDFDIPEKSISLWFYSSTFPVFNYDIDPANSWNSIITADHSEIINGLIYLNVSNFEGNNIVWFSQFWGHEVNPSILSYKITPDTWYHVAITMNSEEIKFYINGNLVGTHASWFGHSGNGYQNLLVGTTRIPNGRYLDGGVDDLRIYNRVLTSEEIKSLSM